MSAAQQGDILGMCSLFGWNLAALIALQFVVSFFVSHLQTSKEKIKTKIYDVNLRNRCRKLYLFQNSASFCSARFN
jgi:hypothetical protein